MQQDPSKIEDTLRVLRSDLLSLEQAAGKGSRQLDPELSRTFVEKGNELRKLAHSLLMRSTPDPSLSELEAPFPNRTGVPITRDQILVVPKLSKVERDLIKLDLSESELRKVYEEEQVDADALFESAERQRSAREQISTLIPKENHCPWENYSPTIAGQYRLVVAAGGDNHLQYVAQHLRETPVLGVNTDMLQSEGALLTLGAEEFGDELERIERGEFLLSPWSRIKVKVGDRQLPPVLGEVLLAKTHIEQMSRHVLEYRGEQVIQKGSGLLVCTGAGSTGWTHSATWDTLRAHAPFPRTAGYLRFALKEPYVGRTTASQHLSGFLLPHEALKVHSLNNHDGFIVGDSLGRLPFPRGTVAEISLSDSPLWVVSQE